MLNRFAAVLVSAAFGACAALPASALEEIPAAAGPTAQRPTAPRSVETVFPRSDVLAPKVAFWTRVFAEYSEYQSVVHSRDYPHLVWEVLDFRDDAQEHDEVRVRREQRREEERSKREINTLLARVHELRSTPEKMNTQQRAVYELFAGVQDPLKFKKAIGRFRAQRGLQERTKLALEVSGKYLPEMERIFAGYGLPRTLTRLPLVESSFNVEAYSKVGAAGLWQFMPSSARIYMRLNEVVDDRRDPWTSTHAAARHLSDDYQALGSWPLAVTAYNHGRQGVSSALGKIRGKTLEDLLARWDGRRFGFASRNFYAEFLAASDVERDYRTHFGEVKRRDPLEFEVVETQHYVPYDVLRRLSGVDDETFRKLNPAYRDDVVAGKLYVPPSHSIRVPAGAAAQFKTAYASLGEAERFAEQRAYYAHHRVQRGETMGRIARVYGVSLKALRSANASIDPRRMRVGQMVRIPPRGGARLVKAVAKVPAARKAPAAEAEIASVVETAVEDGVNYLLHQVQPGEALYTIAKRYRTTVTALRRLNDLGRSNLIHAGTTLKIPAGPAT